MANTILTPSIIASEACLLLDNELVMAKRVFRGHESEFEKKVNGYNVGDTVSIRKPAQFGPPRTGAVASIQDATEGKTTLVVNNQKGIDFKFSSLELTLSISELSERIMKPAMVQLANAVDRDLMSEFYKIPNWVGQPATGADATVSTFAKFAAAAQRLDELAVPSADRTAVLAPDSWWALAGAQTSLFSNGIVNPAYREGEIGDIGGIKTYMSQNVPTFTTGTGANDAALVNGAGQAVTYATVKDTDAVPGQQTLNTDTWGATNTIPKGTVFTISGVFAVNPVTKQTLPFLQHFTTLTDVTAAAGVAALTISPAIITSGAFQTVSAAPADNAPLTVAGDVSAGYRQNMVFHKNAFTLAMVPMVKPPGAVDTARKTYKGISVRVVPYYDGVNDVSNYRLDILYGFKLLDGRLATRLTGGASTI